MVDAFTQFHLPVAAPKWNEHFLIKASLKRWIAYFEPPEIILFDNGVEYMNQEFAHFCSL